MSVLADQSEQMVAHLPDFSQTSDEYRFAKLFGLFPQHFALANNRIKGRIFF